MPNHMSEGNDAVISDEGHHEAAGLATRALGAWQIVALALASQTPAVALVTVPFLLVVTAGNGSWLGALMAAVATGCVGIAVITFARRYVVTGSLYSYVSYVFGPWARLLVGASLLLGYVALIAGVLLLTGIFAASFVAAIGMHLALGDGGITLFAVLAMVVSAALAYRGLDASVRTAVVLTVATLPVVLLITVATALHTGLALGDQFSLHGATAGGVFQGAAAGGVFLVAFESSAALAVETRHPKRSVPLAVMCIPIVLGSAYMLAAVMQVPGLTAASDALNGGGSPAAVLAEQAGLGTGLATATDLVLAVANIASLIAFVNYGSRFVATLATDGLLPSAMAKVHPRHRSPHVAIIGLSALASVLLLVLVGLFPDDLLTHVFPAISTLTVYMWIIPWALVCIGCVVLVVRERRARPALITAVVVGAAGMLWIYVNGLVNAPAPPVDAMSYVCLIAAGAVFSVFFVLDKRRRRRSTEGEQADSSIAGTAGARAHSDGV